MTFLRHTPSIALLSAALLFAGGCIHETRTQPLPPGSAAEPASKVDRQVAALKLIEEGRQRKLEGMNLTSNMYRHAGPNRIDLIRDGQDMIQKGQRLKAEADDLPD